MRNAFYRVSVLVVVLALMLPSFGAILDHHFAERQPGHLHMSADGYYAHKHAYEDSQHHHYSQSANDFSGGYPVVLVNYDSAQSAITELVLADTAMDEFLQYEPTSVLILPLSITTLPKDAYVFPPGKPPDQQI